jgi:rhodanese-related sulfurtransferase
MSRRTKRITRSGKAGQRYRSGRSLRTVGLAALILVGVFGIGFLALKLIEGVGPWQLSDDISPTQAREQISNGAVVVDVRTREEYVSGHIENSLWMPVDLLTSLMGTLPRNRLVITVCRTGVRSAQARDILEENGFNLVTSLTGGMEAWIAAGFPVVPGEPIQTE